MNNTPKNFVLQLGSLVALYVSVTALLTLIFSTINVAIPDPAATSWEWASNQSTMRLSLALLFVFFPTYIILTRLVNQARRTSDAGYLPLTQWLIYLSLLVGGLVILIDLVVIIMTYLEGELTSRFLLKAGATLVVISVVLIYYLKDARGYWQMRPRHSIMYGAIATAIVIGFMSASLYHIETPGEARERRIDQQQVRDLQDIQWRIESFYTENQTLPESIDELYVPTARPEAPEPRPAYEYNITGEQNYELCAEFAHATTEDQARTPRPTRAPNEKNYTWDHGEGRWCFERTPPEREPRLLD